ncbi:MAG TPA: DUF1820 family protein [Mariprofundaceae bacterium]|nr:DUF1820 family protein [Mariprofundaceae bacterium]
MARKRIFRIRFHHQDKIYEIYAHSVGSAGMLGFVEVADLAFGEKSAILLDPSEEGLKNEFAGVKRTYIPLHSIIRIDEVEKQGPAKVSAGGKGNIMPFPVPLYGTSPDTTD